MSSTEKGTMEAWVMVRPGEPFEKRSLPVPSPGQGEALVRVAGCGVCHTDISFLRLGVKTRTEPPLVLGHEVSGTVAAVGDAVDAGLAGKAVLVPAVLPCGVCELCKTGHRTICRSQVMPGNDRNGGFAPFMTVPALYLCPVGDTVLAQHELWELAVVSDAVTTPFQAVRRSGLEAGDLAVVIGIGGIGIHAVQIAAAAGAKVVALDIDPRKLELAASHGAGAAIDVSGLATKDVRARVGDHAKRLGAGKDLWKIFETSGTRAGQETAVSLIGFGASVAIVGFTMDRLEVRLSNLMAYDAAMRGNWGCDPLLYPEVLEWIAGGRIHVRPFVERHPLDEINRVFEAAHHGALGKRAVLVP